MALELEQRAPAELQSACQSEHTVTQLCSTTLVSIADSADTVAMGQSSTEHGPSELDTALEELDRLTGCAQLERPVSPLVEPEDPRRDPSPNWDHWYNAIGKRERRQLLTFMAPARRPGDMRRPGIALDELASDLFCSVDTALECWRGACQDIRRARDRSRRAARTAAEQLEDSSSELYADEWERFEAEQLRRGALDILGPQELAAKRGVSVAVIHQWRRRGKLPPADLIVSGVPLWHVDTLELEGVLQ